jgi:EREBP-like factor
VPGKKLYIGLYKTEEDAARAFDDAARRLRGEFARLNFPANGEQSALRKGAA